MTLKLRFLTVFLSILAMTVTSNSAQAQCGEMSYSCTGVANFSGTQALEDYDAELPLDRTCFGTAYYRRTPNSPLDGLVMVLAGKNLAEQGYHRLCFAWGLGRSAPKTSEVLSGSLSSDQCFLVKDGTSSLVSANNERGQLNCVVKVRVN